MSATTVGPHLDTWLAAFAAADKPGPRQEQRRHAMQRFAELGFPDTHQEEWRYTNLAPLARTAFLPAPPATVTLNDPLAALGSPRLVFVNGRFAPELSTAPLEASGIEHLGRYASFEDHAFVALNTAFFEDAAVVRIPRGKVLEQPVNIVYVADPGSVAAVTHPRTLIVAGENSQASVIETYISAAPGTWFTNAVTEIVAAEGANIEHVRVQAENPGGFHFGLVRTEQGRSSSLATTSVTLGGALVRNEAHAVLSGEGAEAVLNGLYMTRDGQHVDNHTTIDHAEPHCTSHELYKGVLDGRSEGVFRGRIIVRPGAQKTDAIQRNRNLLLSDDAVINTKPQLEIYADDVRCTHGATVGQADPEALFYLRSRGVGFAEARELLTYAFAAEVLGQIKVPALREHLERRIR